ncbi:hypothetical protein TRFO_10190 [Tritrichomonas foetus]|uniref:Nucleotide-diphospho-sugar transferase domain-containing protein n=1 Tax=Tritrichomonas foetus TaxID=1144522 RepID=A0A1J4JBH2_9EUKA|nr:hypothetical protein TRFO_10190 [Tritrichomonas foetus]|eukprot:OHS96017.1 hypothetical protein TRFO_10190 [Tritrichomonas foetus]
MRKYRKRRNRRFYFLYQRKYKRFTRKLRKAIRSTQIEYSNLPVYIIIFLTVIFRLFLYFFGQHDITLTFLGIPRLPIVLIPISDYADYIGSVQWLNNNYSDIFEKSVNIYDCQLCVTHQKTNKYRSNEHDLVLTCLFGIIVSSLNFVRTLRSANCKATIVIFTDDKCQNKLNEYMKNIFQNCGVNWINLGEIGEKYITSINSMRMVLFYGFLKKVQTKVNRVMIVDMTDTYFQMDPFTDDVYSDSLILTLENQVFLSGTINEKWLAKILKLTNELEYLSDFDDRYVINNGFLIGGIYPVLKFYSIILDLPQFVNYSRGFNDQAIVNYMYYFDLLKGINVILSPIGGIYQSLTACDSITDIDEDTHTISIYGTKLAVLHQFDRTCENIQNSIMFCPKESNLHLEAYSEVRYSFERLCENIDKNLTRKDLYPDDIPD